MRSPILLLIFLQFATGEIPTKLSTHYSGVPKIVCDSLPYRTIYLDLSCYFVIDADVDLPGTIQKCTEVLSRAKLADQVPDYVWSSLFVEKEKFLLDKDTEGRKKALCIYDNPFPEPIGSEEGTLLNELVPIQAEMVCAPHPVLKQLIELPVPGQILIVKGTFFKNAEWFVINIKSGDAIALHMNWRFLKGEVAFNSCPSFEKWGKEERKSIPILRGNPFDIRVRFHADRFQIFVNLKEYYVFKFRAPITWCKTVWIQGNAHLNYVHLGEKYNPLPYSISSSGPKAGKDIGIDEKMITTKISMPYLKQFDERIAPGHNLTVKGGVASRADWIVVNLQNANGNVIALHFKFCFSAYSNCLNQVVHNSAGQYGAWGLEERRGIPIKMGDTFEFLFSFYVDRFRIFVNQKLFHVYSYRMPLSAITHLFVGGQGYIDFVQLVGDKYEPAPVVSELSGGLPICGERYCVNSERPTSQLSSLSHTNSVPLTNCKSLHIEGAAEGDRMTIQLLRKNGESALHITPRFSKKVLLLKTMKDKKWLDEVTVNQLPFKAAERFQMEIINEAQGFQIIVNGDHLASYPHRVCTFDIAVVQTYGINDLDIHI